MSTSPFLAFIICSFLFLSPFWISLNLISKYQNINERFRVSVFLIFGCIGLSCLPALIGIFGDLIGLKFATWALFSALIFFSIYKIENKSIWDLFKKSKWIFIIFLILFSLPLFLRALAPSYDYRKQPPYHGSEKLFDIAQQQSFAISKSYPIDNLWLPNERWYYHTLHQALPGISSRISDSLFSSYSGGVSAVVWSAFNITHTLLAIFGSILFLSTLYEASLKNTKISSYIILILTISSCTLSQLQFTLSKKFFDALLRNDSKYLSSWWNVGFQSKPFAYITNPFLILASGESHSFLIAIPTTISCIAGVTLLFSGILSRNLSILLICILSLSFCSQVGGHPPSLFILGLFTFFTLIQRYKIRVINVYQIIVGVLIFSFGSFVLQKDILERASIQWFTISSHQGTTILEVIYTFFCPVIIAVTIFLFTLVIRPTSILYNRAANHFFYALALSLLSLFLFTEYAGYDLAFYGERGQWLRFNSILRHWLEISWLLPLVFVRPVLFILESPQFVNRIWVRRILGSIVSLFLLIISLSGISLVLAKSISANEYFSIDGFKFLKDVSQVDFKLSQSINDLTTPSEIVMELCGLDQSAESSTEYSRAGRISAYSGRHSSCGWTKHVLLYSQVMSHAQLDDYKTQNFVIKLGELQRRIYKGDSTSIQILKSLNIKYIAVGELEHAVWNTEILQSLSQKLGCDILYRDNDPHYGLLYCE